MNDKKLVNLAIDFGTTNTLVAYFEDTPKLLSLPGISYRLGEIDLVPSIIGYSKGKSSLSAHLGQEAKKLPTRDTVRRMKLFVDSKRASRIHGEHVSFKDAIKDFYYNLISSLRYRYLQSEIDTIVFTVPVDSFDTYRSLIDEMCEEARIRKYQILDESTAAALGYEAAVSLENPYMVADFGGGTLDISIIKLGREGQNLKAKVLGKASAQLGGSDIDDWLLDDFIDRNNLGELRSRYYDDEDLRTAIEQAKVELCEQGKSNIFYSDKEGDFDLKNEYTIKDLERILNKNNFSSQIQEAIDNAIDQGYENGIKKADIVKVMLIGGSSRVKAFSDVFETNFGKKVEMGDPYGAVVRGAANFLNDRVVDDFLHHRYALEYLNEKTGFYDYEVIIEKGCKYPSQPIRRLIVTPFNGQKKVALKFFEISESKIADVKLDGVFFDEQGQMRASKIVDTNQTSIPLNPNNPEFINLDPPSKKGTRSP